MTSAAAAAGRHGTGRIAAGRLTGALPLLTIYTWIALVLSWQAWLVPTPSIFPDELQYAELGRSIADSGQAALRGAAQGWVSLPAWFTAPAWLLPETADAYLAAKLIGVLAMTSVVFPAYGLARLVAPRGPALWAAAAAGTIPAVSYSALLMEEPFAYPAATLVFYLGVRALARPSARALAFAGTAGFAAALVRPQLALLPAVLAAAVASVAWRGERVRAWRAGTAWSRLAVPLGLGVVALAAHLALVRVSPTWEAAAEAPGDVLRYAAWALGALVLGLAALPVVVTLAAAATPGHPRDPAWQAFLALLVAAVVAFALYTGVKIAYLADTGFAPVEERNVIYLAPLFLAGTARWLGGPRLPLAAIGAAGLATLALVRIAPDVLALPYFEAPGVSLVEGLREDLGLTTGAFGAMEVALVAGAAVLATLSAVSRRGRLLAHVAAALVLAVLAGGELYAASAQHRLATQLRDEAVQPLDWLDRATDGRVAAYVARGPANLNALFTLEFWNTSLEQVGVLGGFPPGPGPGLALAVASPDGQVAPDPGASFVVADARVNLVGRAVRQAGAWRLYRVDGPLRLADDIEGVFGDGWAGALSAYTRYTGAPSGSTVEVSVARTAWRGPSPRSDVLVRVGGVAVGPGGGAYLAGVEAERRGRLGSGGSSVVRLPAPPGPFRVEVSVSPTFVPAAVDPRSTDTRALGAQVSFSVVARTVSRARAAAQGACARSGRSRASARACAG